MGCATHKHEGAREVGSGWKQVNKSRDRRCILSSHSSLRKLGIEYLRLVPSGTVNLPIRGKVKTTPYLSPSRRQLPRILYNSSWDLSSTELTVSRLVPIHVGEVCMTRSPLKEAHGNVCLEGCSNRGNVLGTPAMFIAPSFPNTLVRCRLFALQKPLISIPGAVTV